MTLFAYVIIIGGLVAWAWTDHMERVEDDPWEEDA